MASITDLIQSRLELRKFVPPTNPGKIVQKFLLPSVNAIIVKAEFESLSSKEKTKHLTLIVFEDVRVSTERDDEHPLGFEVLPGEWFYASRPSKSKSRVTVNCSCFDYYYAWWKWNSKVKAFAGKNLPKYSRITAPPPEGLPYKNPQQVPGLCKHILLATELLGNWIDP